MAKIATKLLIALSFLLIFLGFFIYWQRSSILGLIAYQLLKSEGVYAVDADIESVNLSTIAIKKAVIKMEGHPFQTTIRLDQLRCQLIFYDLLSPICAPLHIQHLSIGAHNRNSETPPEPELILAMHDRIKKIAAHPVLSQKTEIEQLDIHIEPYGIHTLQINGNLRIEAGQVYLYYHPLRLPSLPFEIAGHLYILNEHTEMALKTEKSHLKTQWVMIEPSQRIHKQLHITANGNLDLTEYQILHQKLNLRPTLEGTGSVQLHEFDLNMPMDFDTQIFKSALFRLKTKVGVDGSLRFPDQTLSKIDLLSDFFVDYSAEQMSIRFSATEASAQYLGTLLNFHSSDEHTLSWNGENHWHLNIQSPIHWNIEQNATTLAKGMAENITFYQGNQTHMQLTLFSEESTTLALQPAITSMTLPPYQITLRIDQESNKWLFDFSATKPQSDLSAHFTGTYLPEDRTWQNQIKIESALTEIAPLLLLLEHLQKQIDQPSQTVFASQSTHSPHLFSLPLSLIKQISQAQLFYQGTIKGQLNTPENTEIAHFFTPHFWKSIEWTASHGLTLDDTKSYQPWLRWNQIHLEVTDQKPDTEHQQRAHYSLQLKQSHFLKSLTDAQIEGDFYLKEHSPFPYFERSQAIFDLWHGKAKTTEAFSWHPEQTSQWILELSQIHLNELFKLHQPNRYSIYPDLALGSLTVKASPHFQTMTMQAKLTTPRHSDLTDKVNNEHFSLPASEFNFEVDENHLTKLTSLTGKNGLRAPWVIYSTPLPR